MSKGGKREGAGAKLRSGFPTIVRGIRFTVNEWDDIKAKATSEKISPSEYIRRKSLCLDNV